MCGGFLINSEELDEVLMSHPAVVEAATVGLPDNDFGEIAVSAVVLDTAADEFELTNHCTRLLEPRKVPKHICIVPSIPRGDAGKAQLAPLRDLLTSRIQSKAAGPRDIDLAGAIIEIASRTFRTPAAQLSLDSSPETVARWDSFAHINLVLNVERQLNARIATADAIKIDSLRKLVDIVRRSS